MASIPASRVRAHDADPAGLPAVCGCPFPADQVTDEPRAATVGSAPAQAATLTPTTAAGVRWVELSWLATEPGNQPVTLGDASSDQPIATESNNTITLDNGVVRITLNSDGAPVTIDYNGRERFGALQPEVIFDQGAVRRDFGVEPRTIKLLRNGPIRAQAELHGTLTSESGKPGLAYRLTVELWKDMSAARVDWMLSHLVPGEENIAVHRATLRGDWQVGGDTHRRFIQNNHSEFYVSRTVDNPQRVEIATDFSMGPPHVTDPAMLLDDEDYAHYLAPPTVGSSDWLALVGGDAAVYATIGDFMQMRPTSLESSASSLDFHFLPDGHTFNWPQGRRREQTLLLGFAKDDGGQAEAIRQMKGCFSPGRAAPTPQTLADLKCCDQDTILAFTPGKHFRLTTLMDRLCRLKTSADKWNLGDTPDPGYTLTYAPVPNDYFLMPGAPQLPKRFDAAGRSLLGGIESAFVEPVWTNNEYDVIHTLALEVMRTGKDDHLNMLRWTAKHNIEVDFVAYNDDQWHHRGIPFHSHFHNTKGVISSHLWTQGLLEYYCLTGDRDALETAHALGEKIIEIDHHDKARTWKFDRELGWALLSLVCLVEYGYDQYGKEADTVAEWLLAYDRTKFSGMVNLTGTKAGRSLERQMVDSGFGYISIVESMDRWQKITGRDDAAQWLDVVTEQLRQGVWEAIDEGEIPGMTRMVCLMMSIGYERSGDKRFIEVGLVLLDHFLEVMHTGEYQFGYVKPSAMVYRALYRFLGHADRLDLLDPYEFPHMLSASKNR